MERGNSEMSLAEAWLTCWVLQMSACFGSQLSMLGSVWCQVQHATFHGLRCENPSLTLNEYMTRLVMGFEILCFGKKAIRAKPQPISTDTPKPRIADRASPISRGFCNTKKI